MRKQAVSYIARVLVQKIIGFLLYMIGARFILTYAGSIYFIYLFIATIIISLVLFKSNEETLAQRGKTDTDSPVWDKVLLTLFWLLNYFVVYWLAGVSETEEHLTIVYWCGIIITLFAAWFSTKATLENTFLESTARIQSDRKQTVCMTGPYRIVRHPAYSGLVLNCIGLCMIFPYLIGEIFFRRLAERYPDNWQTAGPALYICLAFMLYSFVTSGFNLLIS